VPIQFAQCWFPGLAISNAKIQIYFSNKIHRSNFITQRRQNLVSSDSTTVEISCIANPKQIKLMEIEGYSQPMCSKQPRLVDCRIGVVNKLDNAIDLPWRNFEVQSLGQISRGKQPYFWMYPNFVITLCDRWKEASMPKPSWIHPVVSMQITAYDGRTDGQTDGRPHIQR